MLADNRSLLAACFSPLAEGYLNLASCLTLLTAQSVKPLLFFYLIHRHVFEGLGLGNFMAKSEIRKKNVTSAVVYSTTSLLENNAKRLKFFYFLIGLQSHLKYIFLIFVFLELLFLFLFFLGGRGKQSF